MGTPPAKVICPYCRTPAEARHFDAIVGIRTVTGFMLCDCGYFGPAMSGKVRK
jgi:hypothetical protein